MTNVTQLITQLEAFHEAFGRHTLQLQEDYQQLHGSFINLSAAFGGQAAEEFYSNWERTVAVFQDYIAKSASLRALLLEKVDDLKDLDRS